MCSCILLQHILEKISCFIVDSAFDYEILYYVNAASCETVLYYNYELYSICLLLHVFYLR